MDNIAGWLILLGCLAAFRLISDAVYGLLLLILDKIWPRKSVTLTYKDSSGKLVQKKFSSSDLKLFVDKYAPDSQSKEAH